MERLLDIKDAAGFLNVSEMSIRRWTNSGKLNCYRVGGKRERRFHMSDLEEFLHDSQNHSLKPLGIGDPFPEMELRLVSEEPLRLPGDLGEGYAVFLLYRGYW